MNSTTLRNESQRRKNDALIGRLLGDSSLVPKVARPVKRPDFEFKAVTDDRLTVCITNHGRALKLWRATTSALKVDRRLVISSMEPGFDVQSDIATLRKLDWTRYKVASCEFDLSLNEAWLRASYFADTEYVLILHDDDVLKPEFEAAWKSEILPALKRGMVVTWRAEHLHDDGNCTPTEYFSGPTRELPASDLTNFLLRSQLSLSPVITVFRRSVLIDAVKEAGEYLTQPECQHTPYVLLGTEVIAHLRHAQRATGWLYLDKVLSQYGHHDGSGTVKAEKSNNLAPLIKGYDITRQHFKRTPTPPKVGPRFIFCYNDYEPKDDGERERFNCAMETWRFHFSQGETLDVPIRDSDLSRSFEVPYVRDLFDYGARIATDSDIIILCNRDVCLTTLAMDRIRNGIAKTGIVCCQRRNLKPIPAGRLFRTVKSCNPDGGYDVFAVTPKWWRENRAQMPDMLIGREAWDTVMRTLAEEQFGDAVYVDDVCYHSAHESRWQAGRKELPSQLYNRKLGYEFFKGRKNQFIINQLAD